MHVETIPSTHPKRRRGARQVLVILHEEELGGASRAMLGVIPLLEQNTINVPSLRGQAKAPRRQPFGEPLVELEVFTLHSYVL